MFYRNDGGDGTPGARVLVGVSSAKKNDYTHAPTAFFHAGTYPLFSALLALMEAKATGVHRSS